MMKWNMRLKITLPVVMAAVVLFGMVSAVHVGAGQVRSWTGQSGPEGTFTVLFDGKIFTNRWWADSNHCPADAGPDNWNNPWQYKRDATTDEMETIDNPTTCDAASSDPTPGGGGSIQDGTFEPGDTYIAGDLCTFLRSF